MTIATMDDQDRILSAAVFLWVADHSIMCDTRGCDSVHAGGGWAGAVNAGWRTDAAALRRCPTCMAQPWPGAVEDANLKVPATLYRAWWKGDETKLTAWLDAKFGPLEAPPADPADGMDDIPVYTLTVTQDLPAGAPLPLGELSKEAQAHFDAVFSDEDDERSSWRLLPAPDVPGPVEGNPPTSRAGHPHDGPALDEARDDRA